MKFKIGDIVCLKENPDILGYGKVACIDKYGVFIEWEGWLPHWYSKADLKFVMDRFYPNFFERIKERLNYFNL